MLVAASNDCGTYGYYPGTPAYSQCMMAKDGQYMQMEQQRRQALAAGIREINRDLQAQEPVRMAPRTCTSNVLGNQVVTNCQ